MSLLTANQRSAQFRVTGGTQVEMLRKAADLLEDLAEDEYLAEIEFESERFYIGVNHSVVNSRILLEVKR